MILIDMFDHERKDLLEQIVDVLEQQEIVIEKYKISELHNLPAETYLYKLGRFLLTYNVEKSKDWFLWFCDDNRFGKELLEVEGKPISTISDLYNVLNDHSKYETR